MVRVHFHKVVFNMAPGELVSVSYHKELNTGDPNLEIPIFDHCRQFVDGQDLVYCR